MATTATKGSVSSEEKTPEKTPEKTTHTRVRRTYRLGVSSVFTELEDQPAGGFLDNCPQWELGSHKEMKAEDFVDVLHYFEWVQRYASELIAAAKQKCTELAAYGDASTRKEMSTILGNTQSVASALLSQMQKEGMTPEQKAAMAAQIKEILGTVLS